MARKLLRRPSPALAVSIIALVLAASGTAVAASKLVSGNSLIKVNSLSGNRLKSGSVTGKQIKASTLGTVPSATSAQTATTATTAQTATTALSAPISKVTYVSNAGPLTPYSPSVGALLTTVSATCPAGTVAIGGGSQVSDEGADIVNDSYPASNKTGWVGDFYSTTPGSSTGTVTAICAPAAATAP
jgi:hypothetical protein